MDRESATTRRRVPAVVCVAVVLLASCSSNGSAKSASSTTSAPVGAGTTAAIRPTTASGAARPALATKVDAAALSISDFPTGWSVAALASGPASAFCGKPNPLSRIKPDAQQRVAFTQKPQVGPLVEDWVIAFSDVASA